MRVSTYTRFKENGWTDFKDSGIPTLYIMGEEDHMFLPSITKLVRNHVSSMLYIIPECGHVVNVERPQIFNMQVINYLRNIS